MNSFESILYQGRNNDLKSIMLDRFGRCLELIKNDEYNRFLDEIELLSNEIFKITGINIKIRVDEASFRAKIKGYDYAAYIDIGKGVRDVSLLNYNYINECLLNARKIDVQKIVKGSIDFKTNKVSGVFSEPTFELILYYGLFDGTLTAGEIAGITGHELGHAFTTFSTLGYMLVTTAVLGGIEDVFDRYGTNNKVSVSVARSVVQTIDPNTKEDIKLDMRDLIYFVTNNSNRLFTNYTGLDFLRKESFEYLSDQYSNKLGLGPELSSALLKISRKRTLLGRLRLNNHSLGFVRTLFDVFNLGVVRIIPKIGLGSISTVAFWLVFFNVLGYYRDYMDMRNGEGRHPDLIDRINALRSDTIALIKRTDDLREKALLIEDLKKYDEHIKVAKMSTSAFNDFKSMAAKYLSGKAQHINRRQSLQDRQNNPLYELTARLEQLS